MLDHKYVQQPLRGEIIYIAHKMEYLQLWDNPAQTSSIAFLFYFLY
jgi:hypothetical protein